MVNGVLKVSEKLFESSGIGDRRHDRNEHRSLVSSAVRVDAYGILVPGGVQDRELPVAHAVPFASFHIVADVRAEIVTHPHRRIRRDSEDRVSVGIGIGRVRQPVRQPRSPRNVQRKGVPASPVGLFHDIIAHERIEVVGNVVFEGIGHSVRTAAGVRVGVRCRQAQPVGLPLQHRLDSERPSR